MIRNVSVSPDGTEHPLPLEEEYAREYVRVQALVAKAKASGLEIVVVMGVGFVGAVMAAIVADTVNGDEARRSLLSVCSDQASGVTGK